MNGKKKIGGVFIGGSSILMVLILLCLTTFAVLSMVSANADARMTVRAVEAVSEYYAADSEAVKKLAQIDLVLRQNVAECSMLPDGTREAVFADQLLKLNIDGVSAELGNENSVALRYSIPMNDRQALSVVLDASYPKEDGNRYVRRVWKVDYTADWEGDQSLELWSGGPAAEPSSSVEEPSGGLAANGLPAGIGG